MSVQEDDVIVQVDTARRQVGVLEPDMLRRLQVDVTGEGGDDEVAALLAPLGRREADHVWLDVEQLRAAAHDAGVPEGWDEQFDAMLAFAQTHGWTDPARQRVRAHLERTGGPSPTP